jgi:rubrerythrin
MSPVSKPAHKPSAACVEFMSKAYAMELDAAERYADFADQMEVHNNREVAALFRKLSAIEELHARQILQQMGWPRMPEPMYPGPWPDAEPPETAPVTELHYLMQPYQALELALRNEERAEQFFKRLARAKSTPPEVRAIAAEMARDEGEHKRLIKAWMKRVPEPGPDWNRDPDPPVLGD